MKSIAKSTHELFTCDEPNLNGRIYPKEELQKAIDKYQEKIDSNRSFGTLGISDYGVMDLEKVSHRVTKLYIEDENVIANVEILDTPCGYKYLDMIDGFKLVSVGHGKLNDEHKISDYEMHGTYFTMDYGK